jgi:hypothetical protein
MNKPENYTNHSGGAQGADLEWDRIGREYGVKNHVHWRPKDLKHLSGNDQKEVVKAVEAAAIALARPSHFVGLDLVQRNWIPTNKAEAIYAISYILLPGQQDLRGFPNKSGKEVVAGGTGWAVEMAIQMEKPVFVFDMNSDVWFTWAPSLNKFERVETPELVMVFSGIGARALTPSGIKAIDDGYCKTFKNKHL